MHMKKNLSLAVRHAWFLLPLIGLISISCIWWIRSYPSTTRLAKQYLEAVIDSDEEQASRLADFGCKELVRNYAREDIHRFANAEIRNVTVRIENGTGSDTGVQFAWVNFEYRKNSQAVWQSGEVGVMTDFEGMGRRHLFCGG